MAEPDEEGAEAVPAEDAAMEEPQGRRGRRRTDTGMAGGSVCDGEAPDSATKAQEAQPVNRPVRRRRGQGAMFNAEGGAAQG